jgi:hypothetical protein
MTGLFEVLAAEDENPRLASRQALVVAEARTDAMYGNYFKQAKTAAEFDARFALVEDDFNGVVLVACDEVGHKSPANIAQTLRDHYRPYEARQNVDVRTASIHEARVKMCPYHSEVTDISLASGDPSAGFNAMASHAWTDQHCKGSFEGKCNFKKEMVTQSYWDDRAKAREDKKNQVIDEPITLDVPDQNTEQISDQTEAPVDNVIDFPSPGAETSDSGSEGFSGGSEGAGEPMAMAASVRTADNGVEFANGPTDPASLDPNAVDPNAMGGVPTNAPATPVQNPEGVQNAIMTLQQAAMASGGGHPHAQQIQKSLADLQGMLYGGGGLTAAWTPKDVRTIAESGVKTPDSRTASPKEYNPASDKDDSPKQVTCPLCGGDNPKCSRCHGKGKVSDWGPSALDALESRVATETTGLGGPEPKIDKRKWTPENLDPIKSDGIIKDILEPIIPKNDDELKEIGDIKKEELPSGTGLDDGGFAPGGESKGPKTKTWPKGDQADPVTNKASD